jgi:hypothetical protein
VYQESQYVLAVFISADLELAGYWQTEGLVQCDRDDVAVAFPVSCGVGNVVESRGPVDAH